jgi:6-phosphogluconolactonase (cycloisomerase 2 family)
MKTFVQRLSLALVASLTLVLTAAAQPLPPSFDLRLPFIPVGAVYTTTNAANSNAVVIFERALDGRLRAAGTFPTGGRGTGAGLANQGALSLSEDERWLIAVNAGTSDISVFEVQRRGLRLVSRTASGGSRPISVTQHRGLLYVLNAGSDSISGFTLTRRGTLDPLPGSTRALSGAGVDPAQIAFSPGGEILAVTEKATNQIVTYALDRNGLPGEPQVHAAAGQTPFGFAFGRRDQLFVSEALGGATERSALSSYTFDEDGGLTTVSASVATTETSACWVAVTPDGRFVYTTNTGSGSVTGYEADFDGELKRLDDNGRTGVTGNGSTPIDVAISRGGLFLFELNNASHTIGAFLVTHTGDLIRLAFTGGLPPNATGLVVR